MSCLTREDEILLREYEQAGQTCRWYEKLKRTSLSLFMLFSAGFIGFILAEDTSYGMKFTFSICGLIVSLLIWNTHRRTTAYYTSYIIRAKEIENQLGMQLYNKGWEDIKKTRLTFRNSIAFSIVYLMAAAYFLFLAIYNCT